MIRAKTLQGSIRLCAALILSILLFPYMIRVWLVLSPGAEPRSVWDALIQAIPFGDWLATVVISLWSEAQSGVEALSDWLTSSQVPFPIHLTVELGKLVFSSVLLLVVTNFVGKKVLIGTRGGVLNHIADVVFQVLCCFGASLIADIVFRFFESQLEQAGSAAAQGATVLFSIATGGGSLWILIVLQVVFLSAILSILLSCLKLLISYSTLMCLLLNEILGGPDWLMPAGIVVLLLLLWLIQQAEKLLLPS